MLVKCSSVHSSNPYRYQRVRAKPFTEERTRTEFYFHWTVLFKWGDISGQQCLRYITALIWKDNFLYGCNHNINFWKLLYVKYLEKNKYLLVFSPEKSHYSNYTLIR